MTMVIWGSWLRFLVTATHAPRSAATIGMSQTSESRVRLLGTLLDSVTEERGGSRSGICNLFRICRVRIYGIPDESRIERLDREHREHHYRRKQDQAGAPLHFHQRRPLN